MRYFIATVTILDGEHNHNDQAVLTANNYGDALDQVEKVINNDNKGDCENPYFTWGDGIALCKLESIVEINLEIYEIIMKHSHAIS